MMRYRRATLLKPIQAVDEEEDGELCVKLGALYQPVKRC